MGVGATTFALIQLDILRYTIELNRELLILGHVGDIVRADPSRLIAQVVSGIGFLGAGTIIVTKRNISGLTTASSIWSVAAIGIALGMGFYEIAIGSFVITISTLVVLKRVVKTIGTERVVIKYLSGEQTLYTIESLFKELNLEIKTIKYSVSPFGNEFVSSNLFEINNPKNFNFSQFVEKISHIKNIVSVERTNLE